MLQNSNADRQWRMLALVFGAMADKPNGFNQPG